MFLLIDKPAGFTSFKVIHLLRKRLGIKKIGHAGTLDPLATGLLIVACGRSTRFLEYIFGWNKVYHATAVFGLSSPTYDFEGNISVSNLDLLPSKEQILDILPQFRGQILHTPPPFSAVKYNGRKAYERARKGQQVVLPQKQAMIFRFDLLAWKKEQFEGATYEAADFLIECSKGTYVRSLIHEIGQKFGCGAVLKSLRRIKVGHFSVDDERVISGLSLDESLARPFESLTSNIELSAIPYREMFQSFPSIDLSRSAIGDISKGRLLPVTRGLFSQEDRILGLYHQDVVGMLRMKGKFLLAEKMV